jgi:putative chitinase
MSLIELQKKIGVTADGAFGPGTLKAAAAYYKLSPNRAAHFFAQTAHESGNFKAFSENLNYGAKGLRGIFGKYFQTDAIAKAYERQPQRIANRAYANRMGNGDEASGEGFAYKGRGPLQLTGKNNYRAFGRYIGREQEILDNPDLVATELGFESALWFFDANKLWSICDKGINESAIRELSSRINGSKNPHGLDDRRMKTKKYAAWL